MQCDDAINVNYIFTRVELVKDRIDDLFHWCAIWQLFEHFVSPVTNFEDDCREPAVSWTNTCNMVGVYKTTIYVDPSHS